MNITINDQILSGNLGEGWADNNVTAAGLAEFTRQTWLNDLAGVIADGHQVEIGIEVIRNTDGCGRDLAVWADDVELEQRVEELLTDSNTIWERFCSSEEAENYFEAED